MTYKIAVLMDAAPGDARQSAYEVCDALKEAGHEATTYECDMRLAASLRADKPQLAFNGAQGKLGVAMGELCELLDIPVIGSSSAARMVAGDASELAGALDGFYDGFDGCASCVQSVVLDRLLVEHAGAAAVLDAITGKIASGYPLVVRPARGYGQMGVARVDDEQQLRDALPAAFAVDERVMICELVEGVRMCVAVLGDAQDPYALPAVEVVPTASGEADFFAPVRLESLSHDETMAQAIRSEVERAAVEASAVLGCCDYSCVEIVWDGARAKVMRVDPNPSLGEGSVFLKGCQVAGISRDALLAELIDQAFARG